VVKRFVVEPTRLVGIPGATVKVSWEVEHADKVVLEPGGEAPPISSKVLPVSKSTLLSLIATGRGGEKRAQADVIVDKAICTVMYEGKEGVALRSGPGPTRQVLQALFLHDVLTPDGRYPGRWLFVHTADGNEGWVREDAGVVECNFSTESRIGRWCRPAVGSC
jgi:hypothetical protein